MSIERRLPLLLLVTLLALLPAMSACDSNEPGIEPRVEALIDGAPFVAAQTNSSWFEFECLSGATTVRGTIIYGAAPIGEGAAVGEERLFLFTTRPIDGPGAYDIVTLDYEGRCGGVSYYWTAGIDGDDPFYERSVYHALSGRVTVDDADGGVLSGTFEMEAENGEGTALSVRDGRFTVRRGAEN
jgi:hypothetical protein